MTSSGIDYRKFDKKKLEELDLALQRLRDTNKLDGEAAQCIYVIGSYVQSIAEKLKDLDK